ncbi:hypothetical protein HanRHA438_Chr03g0130511 [Helianthus annuus]|nr:hypothetical protein HanRHA438_Chr03g0130511 [Helianthus annuus]
MIMSLFNVHVSSLELARLPYMSSDKLLLQVVYINQIDPKQ